MSPETTVEREPDTVLVVDDTPLFRRLCRAFLEKEGYYVVDAERPDAVMDLIGDYRPMLVLLDINMPEISGFDLIQRIRAEPTLAGLKVAAVTTVEGDQDDARFREAGFDAYIAKPIRQDAFLETVRQLTA